MEEAAGEGLRGVADGEVRGAEGREENEGNEAGGRSEGNWSFQWGGCDLPSLWCGGRGPL